VARSQVRAAALLPQRLSASACEALRACPYRFFAQHMLGLRDTDELERELEKRDYGTWLHAVLHAFHEARGAPAAADEEVAALHAAARAHSAQIGLEAADFVPFAASFAGLAPRYVAWLHARDLQGRRWRGGELSRQAFPGPLQGVELHGVIDRIDSCGEAALELIDYKTGSAQALRDRVAEPLEDTQLAFYATLMGESDRSTLSAIYLALDETHAVQEVAHPDVARSAAALVQGLAVDLSRLRAGASLIALGEGRTCEHCAARGVCRRDDWASAQLPASDATPDPPQDPVQERASAPP
jgi:ATP-dependent helicase/nuclease subunit B